ncbi:MAG: glycerol-3-phosphate acyltransferase, partial [Actinobacteria bacterium]|nr:glycerol-3-phosphate acyltransferase [Actinomycetota bacterium]
SFIIASYLLGSVCFGYVFAIAFGRKDFAKKDLPGGSGSFRQLGRSKGIIVGFLDTFKGMFPPLIAQWPLVANIAKLSSSAELPFMAKLLGLNHSYLDYYITISIASLAVIAGHNWPIFFKFRGGGGLSTTIGLSWILVPREFWIAFPVAIISGFMYKYTLGKRLKFHPTPVGAGVGTLLMPILCFAFGRPLPITILYASIFVLLAVKAIILTKTYGVRIQIS